MFEQIFPRHIEYLKAEMSVLDESELKQLGDLCRILGTGRRKRMKSKRRVRKRKWNPYILEEVPK